MEKHQHKHLHAAYMWEVKAAPEKRKKQQNPHLHGKKQQNTHLHGKKTIKKIKQS